VSNGGKGVSFGHKDGVSCGKDIRELVDSRLGVEEVIGLDWNVVNDRLEDHLKDGYDRIFRLEVLIDALHRNLTGLPDCSKPKHPTQAMIQKMVSTTCRNQWGDLSQTNGTDSLGICAKSKCGFESASKRDIASVHMQATDDFKKHAASELAAYDVDYKRFKNVCVKSMGAQSAEKDTNFICNYFCEKLATSAIQIAGKPKATGAHLKSVLKHKVANYKLALAEEQAEQSDCKQLRRQLTDFKMAIDYCEAGKEKLKKNIVDLLWEKKKSTKTLETNLKDLKWWITQEDATEAAFKKKFDELCKTRELADHEYSVDELEKQIKITKEVIEKVSTDYTTAMETTLILTRIKEELAVEIKSSLDFYYKAIRDPLNDVLGPKGEKLELFKLPTEMEERKILGKYAESLAKKCKDASPELKAMNKNYFMAEQPEECKPKSLPNFAEAHKKYKEATNTDADGLSDICRGLVQKPDEVVKEIVDKITLDQRGSERSPVKILQEVNSLRIELDKDSDTKSEEVGEPRYFSEFVARYYDSVWHKNYMQFWSVNAKNHGVYYFVSMEVQLEQALKTAECSKAEWQAELKKLEEKRDSVDETFSALTTRLEEAEKDYEDSVEARDHAHKMRLEVEDAKKRIQENLEFLVGQIARLQDNIDKVSEQISQQRDDAYEAKSVLQDGAYDKTV